MEPEVCTGSSSPGCFCVMTGLFHFICTDLDTTMVMPGTHELESMIDIAFFFFFRLNLVNFSSFTVSISLKIKYILCREVVNTN